MTLAKGGGLPNGHARKSPVPVAPTATRLIASAVGKGKGIPQEPAMTKSLWAGNTGIGANEMTRQGGTGVKTRSAAESPRIEGEAPSGSAASSLGERVDNAPLIHARGSGSNGRPSAS